MKTVVDYDGTLTNSQVRRDNKCPDRLISPRHKPSNPFSWNTVEVYASKALMADCAARISETTWAVRLSAHELLWELYQEYAMAYSFDAYALGFNDGKPYKIACSFTETKAEFRERENIQDMRSRCFIRVRLDLPPEQLE